MKKIILIIISSLIAFNIYAKETSVVESTTNGIATVYEDGKSAVSTVYEDSKDLIKSAYPEIKEAVKSIAGAIGVAAEHVYDVLVKKFIVDGIVYALWFLGGLILLLFGFKNLNKFIKTEDIINWKIIFPIVYMITAVGILLNVNYNDMFMGLINPEYGAINYIIEYTQNMIH